MINTGIFNVAGANVALNKNIAGEGTTVLENEAILKFGDSGKIDGVLKTNGATLDLQNFDKRGTRFCFMPELNDQLIDFDIEEKDTTLLTVLS